MQLLEDHIRREGKVAPGNVLRVDGFLNHQIDVVLLTKLAEEFHTRFSGEKVDKILTIEASGIAIGCLVAQQFGVPLVFAKKSRSSNLPADVYATAVHSYTHGNVNQVVVSREYLHSGERGRGRHLYRLSFVFDRLWAEQIKEVMNDKGDHT